jgi:uncharacterized protein YprB with RNaseH-like and TPR domain
MLTHGFCCFRGISAAAERKLWQAGCMTWDYLPRAGRALSSRKAADLARQLPAARAALSGRVADYFLSRLPAGHRLRVWPDFAEGVAFLDVETTGLGLTDRLTVIGIRQGKDVRQFVQDRDLHVFLEVWRQIEVLVTYNGTRFDLPVLARTFGLSSMPPHIDLMHEARVFGYAGGLKSIERALGIVRGPEETGDGESAVRFWQDYEAGDPAALDRLLHYNERDVDTLRVLARVILRRSFDGYPGPTGMFLGFDGSSLTTEH